jgi:lipopolysaccharide export LptBFGC system permease protein LptF
MKYVPRLYQLFIASNLITPLIVSTIFFVSFLMTFEMFRILSLMSSDEISLGFIAGLMLDVSVTLIPMSIPLSIFFSLIFTLGKMSADSEYVALRAAGLTKLKIFIPFFVVSLCVALNVYLLNQELVPNAHRNVRKKIKIISSASLIQGIKSGQFFTAIPNITMFPGEMDEETLELKDVFLHMYNTKEKEDKIIWANKGKILHEKNENTGLETFRIKLQDGNISSFNPENDLEKILFKEYELPISEQRFSYKPSTKEIMMSKAELKNLIDGGLEKAQERGFKKKLFFNAKYEYWNRYNTPVLCLLLTFLGFGLGITGNRGKSKNSSGKAILYLIGYYFVFFSLVNVARDGNMNVIIAMLIPNVLLFIAGYRVYKNVDWLS